MKRGIQLLLGLLMIQASALSQCPVPTILSPNGGEIYEGGGSVEVIFDYAFDDVYEQEPVDFVYFYYSLDGGNQWVFEDSIAVDAGVVSGKSIIHYLWDVTGIGSNDCLIAIHKYDWGCWDESDGVFVIDMLMSTKTVPVDKGTDLNIYPNPITSGDELIIEVVDGLSGDIEVQIMDRNGKVVRQVSPEERELSISTVDMTPGVYVLLLRNNSRVVSKLFLVR